jgi:hypothetical protein
MKIRRFILVLTLATCAATSFLRAQARGAATARPAAQESTSGCSPSTRDLRATALALRSTNPPPSEGAFFLALDQFVGTEIIPPFKTGAIPIESSGAISIVLLPRYAAYHLALEEALRKMEPIDAIQIFEGHAVLVSPSQMDAPDIIKVVLQKNGEIIPPMLNNLAPKAFQNRMGATTMLHVGAVMYPCSAFTPGAVITITAIPNSGTNFAKTLRLDEIQGLR